MEKNGTSQVRSSNRPQYISISFVIWRGYEMSWTISAQMVVSVCLSNGLVDRRTDSLSLMSSGDFLTIPHMTTLPRFSIVCGVGQKMLAALDKQTFVM